MKSINTTFLDHLWNRIMYRTGSRIMDCTLARIWIRIGNRIGDRIWVRVLARVWARIRDQL